MKTRESWDHVTDNDTPMYGEPEDRGCAVHEGDCLVGKRLVVRGSSIVRPKGKRGLRSGRTHRKQWAKVENGKCWIDREIELKR